MLGLGCVAILGPFGPDDRLSIIVAAAGPLIVGLLAAVSGGRALAASNMMTLALMSVAPPVGALLGTVLAWQLHGGLMSVSVGLTSGSVIGAALVVGRPVWVCLKAAGGRSRRRQVRFALRGAGASLVAVGAGRADVVLLGILSDAASVGLYSVAVGASELVWFAGYAMAQAKYGALGGENPFGAWMLGRRLILLGVLVAAIQSMILFPFSGTMLGFVFGDAFHASGGLLQVLLLGSVAGAPLAAASVYFTNAKGRPEIALYMSAGVLASTALAGILLIPEHGAVGAAWASTAGYLAGGVLSVLLFRRARPGGEPA